MPKRKEPELTPEEQFKRFVETAREHEVDESGQELEKAFRKVTRKETVQESDNSLLSDGKRNFGQDTS